MKSSIKIFLMLVGVALMSCSKSDSPSTEAKLLSKLSQTWQLTSAELNDVMQEGFESFELTLSGSAGSAVFAYGVVGRPQVSPWPSGGTWNFGENSTSQIIRDPGTADELIITYEVSSTQLVIDFQYTGEGFNAAKTASTEGHWVFTFSKK
jgi:hypothetical protein